MARADGEGFRIDVDLDHARREGERVRDMLPALRRRHDLSRFEYTRIVRIVPGGDTFSHPMLTLGNRFADNEDLLLSTYLHEQMHWYLWHLGTPERDPVAPFFDELVRRYPEAPTELPDGARNYEATYLHLVINWLEVAATSELIGRERACARCRDAAHLSLDLPHRAARTGTCWASSTSGTAWCRSARAPELLAENAKAAKRALNGGCAKNSRSSAPAAQPPRSRRKPRARGGRSAG